MKVRQKLIKTQT